MKHETSSDSGLCETVMERLSVNVGQGARLLEMKPRNNIVPQAGAANFYLSHPGIRRWLREGYELSGCTRGILGN